MSLSCSCGYDYDSDYNRFFTPPGCYSQFDQEKGECSSCGATLLRGHLCAKFLEYEFDDEGTEVETAPQYLCERCADLYFSFLELGFTCVCPDDNMPELAKEYADVYGQKEDQK